MEPIVPWSRGPEGYTKREQHFLDGYYGEVRRADRNRRISITGWTVSTILLILLSIVSLGGQQKTLIVDYGDSTVVYEVFRQHTTSIFNYNVLNDHSTLYKVFGNNDVLMEITVLDNYIFISGQRAPILNISPFILMEWDKVTGNVITLDPFLLPYEEKLRYTRP